MQSTPPAAVLLKAAVNYLSRELLPTLGGYHQFQTRVLINVLNTVERELELRAGAEAAEHARIRALLGYDGGLKELTAELCESIRAGVLGIDDAAVRSHVRESLAEALAIDNPRWLVPR